MYLTPRWLRLALAAVATSLVAACGGSGNSTPSIAEVTANDSRFTALNEALVNTGLNTTFQGAGPFTVFAPTDAAFAALAAELGISRQALLANRTLLDAVLRYHVLSSRVDSGAVPLGRAITPLAGGIFKIDNVGGTLTVTDGRNRTSRISATDINTRNGVVHAVDRVLLPADKTIVQTAQGLPQFSILVEAVVAAGLVDALSAAGPFTVFAPTDEAFAALLAELGVTKDELLADTALLTRVLTYHVVPSRVLRAEVPVGTPVTTLQGGTLTVDTSLAITDARGRRANIVATDVLTSNGVIHVVDRVILPLPAENIVQTAQSLPQFSILVEAVVAAGLADALSAPGPLTVFAPTNDAFAALLAELGVSKEALLADTELLTRVLTYHVVPGRVLRTEVPLDTAITTLQGGSFSVDGTLAITDARGRSANIVATDVFASNGVIHVVDRVILPLPAANIVQTAQSLPQFSILVEAVVAAGLVDALSAPGPLTVFAPTNDAFAALLAELGVSKEALLADTALLTQVLTYHVVPGRVLRAEVPLDTAITTLQGDSFTVDGTLAITDQRGRASNIVATDVFTSNGVIHVIDRVILPAP
jgi:uncharacterized surface protein with fasciclin (FAS1) repeats